MRVVPDSSFYYKGRSPKVQEVGRDLGVQYVVEGSVRKAANRIRITAQLVEAASGKHVWAERYDRQLEDIFAVQDELVRTITSTIGGRVESANEARAERLSESELTVYDYVLRGMAAAYRFNKTDNQRALDFAQKALSVDPQNPRAHLLVATVSITDWMAHWVRDRDTVLATAFESAKQAVAMDKTDSTALATLGEIHLYRREFDEAAYYLRRAIETNPNDSWARGIYGIYLTAVGCADEAVSHYDESARINPLEPDWTGWIRGISLFTARHYEEAISVLRTVRIPINEVKGWLAASYANAGRFDEARQTLDEFLRVAKDDMAEFPGTTMAGWKTYWHGAIEYKNENDFEHLFDALRRAGMPD